MPETATRKSSTNGNGKAAPKKGAPAKSKPKAKSNGKPRASANGKAKSKPTPNGRGGSVKKAAAGGAAKATLTTKPRGPVRGKAAGGALQAVARKVGERAREALPVVADGSRAAIDQVRDVRLENLRTLPVQCSIDVAVPLEAAWDEWMRFDWLPDGAHRVGEVERDGDRLFGYLSGPWASGDWEAEIVDEREDDSFAWQTVEGSDTSGLVTFHRLADRLTRLELQLDVVPEGIGQALSLIARQADRRTVRVMRGFKAQVEALDPDEYPPLAEVENDEEDEPADEDGGAGT